MSGLFRIPLSSLLGALMMANCALGLDQARAQSPSTENSVHRSISEKEKVNAQKTRMNAWTVGLAAGLLEGAPIRLATEMARVVDDGDNMHVLPVVTRGPTENVNSLLYLRGIDVAIINSDSLDEYKSQVPDIQNKINYVLSLFPSEL